MSCAEVLQMFQGLLEEVSDAEKKKNKKLKAMTAKVIQRFHGISNKITVETKLESKGSKVDE